MSATILPNPPTAATTTAAASMVNLVAAAAGGGGGSSSSPSNNLLRRPPPVDVQFTSAPVFEKFHSFKEFMSLQRDTLEAERAVQLYDQYKYDFKIHSARKVFRESQHLGFVIERFSPEKAAIHAALKTREGIQAANEIIHNLQCNTYDSLSLQLKLSDPNLAPSLLTRDPHLDGRIVAVTTDLPYIKKDDEQQANSSPFFFDDLNRAGNILVLKRLPGEITSEDIEKICVDLDGLERIDLVPSCWLEENQAILMLQANKEPTECTEDELQAIERVMSECYVRGRTVKDPLVPLQTAWLQFQSAFECSRAELALDGRPLKDLCTCRPMKLQSNRPGHNRIRVTSVASRARLEEDLNLSARLILKLDRAFSIYPQTLPVDESNPTTTANNLSIDPTTNTATSSALPLKPENDNSMSDSAPPPVMASDMSEPPSSHLIKEDGMSSSAGGLSGTNCAGALKHDENLVPKAEQTIDELISEHPFLSKILGYDLDKRLDLQVLYLRKVHHMDFYSGRLCTSARELQETCGCATIRLTFASNGGEDDVSLLSEATLDFVLKDEDSLAFNSRVQSILDFHFQHFMRPIDEHHPIVGEYWARYCEDKTVEVEPGKFRCGICRKLFKGGEFVHKHLKNKHGQELDQIRQTVREQITMERFDSDEANLLLFVVRTNDFLRVFQNTRPLAAASSGGQGLGSASSRKSGGGGGQGGGSEYGPDRRTSRLSRNRGGPITSLPSDVRPYKDWDAPRSRLEEKAAGGNFRKIIRYDDL